MKLKKLISKILLMCLSLSLFSINTYAKNSQNELLDKLKSLTSENVVDTYYDDFDCDGNFELIALTGDKMMGDKFYPSTFYGNIWLVSDFTGKVIVKIDNGGIGAVIQDDSYLKPSVINQGGRKIFKICELSGNYAVDTILVYVENSKEASLQFLDGFLSENNTVNSTAYDMLVEKNDFEQGLFHGIGRSWKDYWYYFDNTDKKYKEYGAIEISEEDFLAFENAKNILDSIEGEIYNILYRDNGIININYYIPWDTENELKNILVSYNEKAVSLAKNSEGNTIGDGFYSKASSDYATYPTFRTPQIQEKAITIILNGDILSFDAKPYIENGITRVPMRAIFEALDTEVDYDANTKTITAHKGNTIIKLVTGASIATINGREVALTASVENKNGSTMVPLRFISEALGAEVVWNGENKIININMK